MKVINILHYYYGATDSVVNSKKVLQNYFRQSSIFAKVYQVDNLWRTEYTHLDNVGWVGDYGFRISDWGWNIKVMPLLKKALEL